MLKNKWVLQRRTCTSFHWKPADRPVAFVITAQIGFRRSMARSGSSAPQLYMLYILYRFGPFPVGLWLVSVGLWPDRFLAPPNCTFCTVLDTFGGSMASGKSRSPKVPIGWLPTTFAPGSFFSKCTKRPCQGADTHVFL